MQPTIEFDRWRQLHESVSLGEPKAIVLVADLLWDFLARRLTKCYPKSEEWMILESIEDALLDYRKRPERFDTSRGVPLPCYLCEKAKGYLRNRLRGERRRRRRERLLTARTGALRRNAERRATGTDDWTIFLLEPDEANAKRRQLEHLLRLVEPRERARVELLLNNDADTACWVRLLEVGHLPLQEQQKRVKHEKVRLKRKLQKLVRQAPAVASA